MQQQYQKLEIMSQNHSYNNNNKIKIATIIIMQTVLYINATTDLVANAIVKWLIKHKQHGHVSQPPIPLRR